MTGRNLLSIVFIMKKTHRINTLSMEQLLSKATPLGTS